MWWEPLADPAVTAYTIYRGENGTVGGSIATVAVGNLFMQGTRFEYIDFLPNNLPVAADPYPLCYAVAAVAGAVTGPQSAIACTVPG